MFSLSRSPSPGWGITSPRLVIAKASITNTTHCAWALEQNRPIPKSSCNNRDPNFQPWDMGIATRSLVAFPLPHKNLKGEHGPKHMAEFHTDKKCEGKAKSQAKPCTGFLIVGQARQGPSAVVRPKQEAGSPWGSGPNLKTKDPICFP